MNIRQNKRSSIIYHNDVRQLRNDSHKDTDATGGFQGVRSFQGVLPVGLETWLKSMLNVDMWWAVVLGVVPRACKRDCCA